jgi:hypothetical protein
MKYLKMLGLAAIAAMGLMAFVGAGTASAGTTKLCTDSACATVYPKGTKISGSLVTGNSATLKSGSTVIATCTKSTVEGSTNAESGSPLSGGVSKLTWEGCNQTTHTVSNGTLDITNIGGTKGTVTGTGNSVTVEIFGTSCTYGTGASTHLGTITSGASPILKINASVPRIAGSSFLCPSSAVWEAEYVLTSPHALYVE